MEWTEVNFGKHKGLTLPQIIFKDADWFFHACENGFFKGVHTQEARELYRRARSIKVPQRNGQQKVVEYVTEYDTRSQIVKFGTMRLITDGLGLEELNVAKTIDFYAPRSYTTYDKSGYKNFVSSFKAIIFDNSSRRMNRRACEEFFNDDDNFDI